MSRTVLGPRQATVLALLCLSCGRREHTDSRQPTAASTRSESKPGASVANAAPAAAPAVTRGPLNVIMLSIDCLRADMPWTGYPRPIAPNLTALAAESVTYPRAYSVSSYTAQSVATMLSGRYASTLYRTGVFFTSYPKDNLFFPEVMKEKGIRSTGWFGHMYFGRGKGIDQGFDAWELTPGITFDPQTDNHVTSDKMFELGKKLLSKPENLSKPFFAWAHFGDPHDQYLSHAEAPAFGGKARDRYDSEVWYTDLYIGKFLDWAKQQPWWANTAVIITGDHGEAFGEHGHYRHAFELWENLVRVPLIVYLPGGKARRIEQRRSHIDLAPTIVDLLGQPALPSFLGKSLVSELTGQQPPQEHEPIVLELAEDSHNPARRAIISGKFKFLARGRRGPYTLYDIDADPKEETDLSKSDPAHFTELRALFDRTFAAIPSVEPYGGMKLESGRLAEGPSGPPKK